MWPFSKEHVPLTPIVKCVCESGTWDTLRKSRELQGRVCRMGVVTTWGTLRWNETTGK